MTIDEYLDKLREALYAATDLERESDWLVLTRLMARARKENEQDETVTGD